MLTEPAYTQLTPFLADPSVPGASGVMVVEYVVTSALASLRSLAAPAGLQTAALSRGVEEDASFASLVAAQALAAVAGYRTVLAGELMAAVRCLRMRGRSPAALTSILAVLDTLPDGAADRDLTGDIAAAEELLFDLG